MLTLRKRLIEYGKNGVFLRAERKDSTRTIIIKTTGGFDKKKKVHERTTRAVERHRREYARPVECSFRKSREDNEERAQTTITVGGAEVLIINRVVLRKTERATCVCLLTAVRTYAEHEPGSADSKTTVPVELFFSPPAVNAHGRRVTRDVGRNGGKTSETTRDVVRGGKKKKTRRKPFVQRRRRRSYHAKRRIERTF